ncbi:MAG: hypothetical protein R2798_03010 [Chitinophagales bacterium]|nr:hypothetical protein [Bacteroidota bacterium]MCB9042300.1 hypothetical protein [Chitinophagales bacterium]
MKAFDLLQTLSSSERKLLKKILDKRANIYLIQVWKIVQYHLNQKTPLPDAKSLISSIYKQKYTKKAHNNLRNLFHQLTEEAKKILIEKQFNTSSYKSTKYQQLMLLDALEKRQASELYGKLLHEELEKSLVQHDYQHYVYLSNRQLRYELLDSLDEKNRFKNAYTYLCEQALHYDTAMKILITERNTIIAFYNAGIQSHISSDTPPYELMAKYSTSNFTENEFIQYLERKQKIFDKNYPDKISLLEENVAFLEKKHSNMLEQDLLAAYNNLFLHHIFQKNYAPVQQILPKLISQCQVNSENVSIGYITLMRLNLLSYCLKTFNFADGHALVEQLETTSSPNPYRIRIYFFSLWYNIFTNNSAKTRHFFQLLQQNELDKLAKFYLKLVEVVLHFVAKEMELAETWLKNITQHLRYNEIENASLREFVILFKKVIRLQLNNFQYKIVLPQHLAENITQQYNAYAINDFYSLPLTWLYFYTQKEAEYTNSV